MTNVRLTRFRLRAYRSCKSTLLLPHSNITALIGPNGAGKTNLLHGLLLLRLIDRQRYFPDERDVVPLTAKIETDFQIGKRTISYKSSVIFRPTDINRDQVLQMSEKWNFKDISNKDEWIEFPLNYIYNRARASHSSRREYYRYIQQKMWPSKLPKPVRSALEAIDKFRTSISYYSASQFTNPSSCPTSFEIDEDGKLRKSYETRENAHVQFLYDLYFQFKNSPDTYNSYNSLIGKLGLGLVNKIEWKPVVFNTTTYEVKSGGKVVNEQRQRTLIIPTVHLGQSQLSPNQLSEGTFRALSLIFYIMTDKSGLLLIEEPEVCIHHGLLNSMIQIIKEYSREKQIIFSTHSEGVVDQLLPEDVILVSKHANRGTVATPIPRAMSRRQFSALKKYLENYGNLGEYWKQSGLKNENLDRNYRRGHERC